jgi:divalent metal cation (Fe/Co/Zn/Cd) transporter
LWVEYASLAWMLVESLVAISGGLIAGSLALLAFGGDSFVELISSYAVAVYIRNLLKSPDATSREVGSEQVERFTTLLLISLIPMIALGGVYSYLSRIEPQSSLVGIAIASGAVVIMPVLWFEKRRIGKQADCRPLSIDAIESATCFLMSVALLGGLLVNYFLHIPWIDYGATVIILAFVAKEAAESLTEFGKKGA